MQFETGESKNDWCFVLSDESKFLARILFFTFPGMHPEYGLKFFAVDKSLSRNATITFIHDALMSMNKLNGASIFTLEVQNPGENFVERTELFQSAGFSFSSARTRYHLDLQEQYSNIILPQELTERSAQEVGDEEFIRGLAIITTESLDTEDRLRIKSYGALQGAKKYFTMERSRDLNMNRWKLYYTLSGEFAGLVIPQFLGKSKTTGTIGHIGVTPLLRGKGFGRSILLRAHQILVADGAITMVDECDDLNFPIKAILEQTGYQKQYVKEYYKKEL